MSRVKETVKTKGEDLTLWVSILGSDSDGWECLCYAKVFRQRGEKPVARGVGSSRSSAREAAGLPARKGSL